MISVCTRTGSHVSHLSDRFVNDPTEVVKVQQKVKVTVLDVDLARQRISLSMKSDPSLSHAVRVRRRVHPPAEDRAPGVPRPKREDTSGQAVVQGSDDELRIRRSAAKRAGPTDTSASSARLT